MKLFVFSGIEEKLCKIWFKNFKNWKQDWEPVHENWKPACEIGEPACIILHLYSVKLCVYSWLRVLVGPGNQWMLWELLVLNYLQVLGLSLPNVAYRDHWDSSTPLSWSCIHQIYNSQLLNLVNSGYNN